MDDHDDFAFEPVHGLPERLPKGERILWQGRPATWALAREAMGLHWIAGYFALLALWRIGASSADMGFGTALLTGVPFLVLGALASLIVLAIAWVQAVSTAYTITTARVAMRIGAALTVTLNLPFRQIVAADLDLRRGGTGTIALKLEAGTTLSYLATWPHVRPWRMKHTEPALRCIPDARRVAAILAEAAETRVAEPVIERAAPGAAVAAE
jgi:hypothetical protein